MGHWCPAVTERVKKCVLDIRVIVEWVETKENQADQTFANTNILIPQRSKIVKYI